MRQSEVTETSLVSIKEFAKRYVSLIDLEHPLENNLPLFNFAVANCENAPLSSSSAEDVAMNSTGWCGLQQLESKLDSTELLLLSDYYGGGAPTMRYIYSGMSEEEAVDIVMELIYNPLFRMDCFAELDDSKLVAEDILLVVEEEVVLYPVSVNGDVYYMSAKQQLQLEKIVQDIVSND